MRNKKLKNCDVIKLSGKTFFLEIVEKNIKNFYARCDGKSIKISVPINANKKIKRAVIEELKDKMIKKISLHMLFEDRVAEPIRYRFDIRYGQTDKIVAKRSPDRKDNIILYLPKKKIDCSLRENCLI